jgi:hypothetical protein
MAGETVVGRLGNLSATLCTKSRKFVGECGNLITLKALANSSQGLL